MRIEPADAAAKGRVRAIPDIAVITGTITTEADQDDTAIDEAAIIINAVQEAVKAQSVDLNFTQIRIWAREEPDVSLALISNGVSSLRHTRRAHRFQLWRGGMT